MKNCWLALVLSGCASTLLPGTADLKLRDALVGGGTDFALADDVEVHVGGTTVHGAAEGARVLATLKPAKARELRHHDVTALVFDDKRVLLVVRNADDRVVRVAEVPAPQPGDGKPWQCVYYEKVWNLDEESARMALLKASWAEKGRYVDPTNDHYGAEGVSKMIGVIRQGFVGTQVNSTTGIADGGGGWLTWDWVMLSRLGGRTFFAGFDIMHVDAEGKIDLLAGFPGAREPEIH